MGPESLHLFYLFHWFSNFQKHQYHLEGLLKYRFPFFPSTSSPFPVADSVDLGYNPRVCISNEILLMLLVRWTQFEPLILLCKLGVRYICAEGGWGKCKPGQISCTRDVSQILPGYFVFLFPFIYLHVPTETTAFSLCRLKQGKKSAAGCEFCSFLYLEL